MPAGNVLSSCIVQTVFNIFRLEHFHVTILKFDYLPKRIILILNLFRKLFNSLYTLTHVPVVLHKYSIDCLKIRKEGRQIGYPPNIWTRCYRMIRYI